MPRRHVLVDGLIDGGTVKDLTHETGYEVPEPRLPQRGNLFRWALSIALMVVLHGFWWFWLSPRGGDVRPPIPHGPTLRILAGESGQRIWRPTVLALPTDIGFSSTVMTNEFGEGPDIRMPRGPVHFLEREAYPAIPERTGEVWTRPPLVVRTPPPPTLAAEPDLVPMTVPASGLLVSFNDHALPGHGLILPDPVTGGPDPWSLTAWVEFDPPGDVRHVLIDQSSGEAERDQAVLRGLYQWRPDHAQRARAGLLSIRFVPSPEDAP